MSQDKEGLGLGSGESLFLSNSLEISSEAEHEEEFEQEGAPDARLTDNDEYLNVTVPVVIRRALRRSHYQEYPTEVIITLRPGGENQEAIRSGESGTSTMVPVSDEPLYQAIVSRAGKLTHGYTSQKCSQCERLGFRVCNKFFDRICVFCQASRAQCEFQPLRKATKSRIKNTNFPREFLYDANRKMQRYIEGFTIPDGFSLHSNCGIIPEDLCVDSDLLDAIHRSASYHCQLLEDWHGESLFKRLDSSALLAMGILAEELVRDQLLGHLVPTEEDEHRRKRGTIGTTGISEFKQSAARTCAREDPSLASRIKNWDSQLNNP